MKEVAPEDALRTLPSGWQISRLKYLGKFAASGIDKKKQKGEETVCMVNYTDVYNNKARIIDSSIKYMVTTCPSEKVEEYALCKGDLLFTPSSETIDEIGYSALVNENLHNTVFSYHLIRFRPTREFDLSYEKYLCHNDVVLRQFSKKCKGSTRKILGRDEFGNVLVPVPPLTIQKEISSYLDRETAHIDALIAEKERMLALLEEKRAALISQAVTRGLDPDVPLKPSGLDWLGDIPAHWETSKFNWNIYIIEGQVDPEIEPYSSMILIAPNHIDSGTGQLIGRERASDQGAISGKYLCKKGDVVYSKIRPALRKVVIAEEDCLCSADMYPFRPSNRLLGEYLLFLLLSDEYSTWAILESERVAMPKINRESLSALRFPLPPIEEQAQIVGYLSGETARIDSQRKAICKSIELLKERRSALITAAVTGQIPPEEMAA